MSSSQHGPTVDPHPGARRAHGRTSPDGTPPPPSRHEPYLDGLFTYCLSVLCDHDEATRVLGDVLAVAERHPGRCPDENDRRAWLYALARWACLRALAEHRPAGRAARFGRTPRHAPGAHGPRRPAPTTAPGTRSTALHVNAATAPDPELDRAAEAEARDRAAAALIAAAPLDPYAEEPPPPDPAADAARAAAVDAELRRVELARLAWPEAAGTSPQQREALELAVRHRLAVPELAAVLATTPAAARELLSAAACEVERTRAALAVVETGGCPTVSRLTGDSQVLLSAALRTELVRHVDDCPRCRKVAERVGAGTPWPGSGSTATTTLPLVPAPRPAVHAALLDARRTRGQGPRFTRGGFPMDPRDRAARRERIRARAVTTTVVATVVAAPVLALWAAYRGDTGPVHPADTARVSAGEAEIPLRANGGPYPAYENAGAARTGVAGDPLPDPEVSVQVLRQAAPAETAADDTPGSPGRLLVEADTEGAVTLLRLRAEGGTPVSWHLWSDGPWLRADRTSGTLDPGESTTLRITVDRAGQPAGPWTAHVGVDPAGAVVEIRGRGTTARPPTVRPPSHPGGRPTPTADRPTDPPTPTEPATPPASTPPPDPEPTTAPPTTPPAATDPPPTPTEPPPAGTP
ncbi:BACON domain-containing protein [Streptomyces sp. BI20]|uniref:BACON domain-containing protein n=1 Tax=Streptomyces sp. BI20 TaxID=3403460 RepID=UPI003C76784C